MLRMEPRRESAHHARMSSNVAITPQEKVTELAMGRDERRWAAVEARDAAFDGRFVFGVQSTGIYCRPSCPSRRPRRDRVRFFDRPAEAEAVGFRACLRCDPSGSARTEGERKARLVAERIAADLEASSPLAELAAGAGISPAHLQRTFTRIFGESPARYRASLRLERLRARLREGEDVAGAGYEAGFGSSRGLYEHSVRGLGMPPGRYRRGGDGLEVRYAVVPCPLGFVAIGATERGLCAVLLAGDAPEAEAALRAELPAAVLVRDEEGLAPIAAEVVARTAGRLPAREIPVDLHGTDFQRRVWAALREIPLGTTLTYSELAAKVGQPTATRAAASACARNHVGVVVPCHRVVRSDGGLGGYRWGLERKRKLLAAEGAPAAAAAATASPEPGSPGRRSSH